MRVFTNVLTPPFKYLRSKGLLSVKYTDDSLLLGETFEICFKNIRAKVALLWELGFTIHPEKLVLVPTQQIIFLGFVIDSVKMTVTLTEERKQSIYMLCQNSLPNYQATIWDLAQTIGVIMSSLRAASHGQMYYRELEKCNVKFQARSGGNFERKVYISEEASKWITEVDKKHFWCFCTHQTSTIWSYNFFWYKFGRLGMHSRSSDRN